MKTFYQLVEAARANVKELFPWDLVDRVQANDILVIDIREPYEYDAMHIQDSLNVPRGILETACEYDFEETVPELVEARDKDVVLVCRSGNRSIFAAEVLQQMGYQKVYSLKTGLRGWNEFEQPLVDKDNYPVSIDDADDYFTAKVHPEQRKPG
ncbi:MAG: rhodanese-like domain-containing protein [Gammaproteobacteria bacterium]|nr:rhodanese-like domain-containing protein [Gammaproteobacteria bacterium]